MNACESRFVCDEKIIKNKCKIIHIINIKRKAGTKKSSDILFYGTFISTVQKQVKKQPFSH